MVTVGVAVLVDAALGQRSGPALDQLGDLRAGLVRHFCVVAFETDVVRLPRPGPGP